MHTYIYNDKGSENVFTHQNSSLMLVCLKTEQFFHPEKKTPYKTGVREETKTQKFTDKHTGSLW